MVENDIINKIAAKMNLDLQKVDEEAEEMLAEATQRYKADAEKAAKPSLNTLVPQP